MSIVDVHADDRAPRSPSFDLEGQTTLLTGHDLPVRVVFDTGALPALGVRWTPLSYAPRARRSNGRGRRGTDWT